MSVVEQAIPDPATTSWVPLSGTQGPGGPQGTTGPQGPIGTVSYGTTFPASPVDGQEHVYPAGAAGELWRFRYNAGSSSAYKWEFVGGTPLQVNDEGQYAVTGTGFGTYGALPTLTFPRSGDYWVEAGFNSYNSTLGAYMFASVFVAGIEMYAFYQGAQLASVWAGSVWRRARGTHNAGAVAALLNKVSAGTGQIISRSLALTPIRVA